MGHFEKCVCFWCLNVENRTITADSLKTNFCRFLPYNHHSYDNGVKWRILISEYRTRAKISNAYSKLMRFLDALIFEHFQNLSYILANFNVFKACLWLKYTFKIYCYALVSTIISKK